MPSLHIAFSIIIIVMIMIIIIMINLDQQVGCVASNLGNNLDLPIPLDSQVGQNHFLHDSNLSVSYGLNICDWWYFD